MTVEEFKMRWDSDDDGGGITNDDCADCSVKWGLCSQPRTKTIHQIRAMVTKHANTEDKEYWQKEGYNGL